MEAVASMTGMAVWIAGMRMRVAKKKSSNKGKWKNIHNCLMEIPIGVFAEMFCMQSYLG